MGLIQQVFKQLVRSLLQGKALSVEDTADLMSLKDNSDSLADYKTCLDLIAADAVCIHARLFVSPTGSDFSVP